MKKKVFELVMNIRLKYPIHVNRNQVNIYKPCAEKWALMIFFILHQASRDYVEKAVLVWTPYHELDEDDCKKFLFFL